jgi:hypothetical protein
VTTWWRAVKGCDARRPGTPYRHALAEGLAGADVIIAPSRAMLDALAEHYGPFADARVIFNGRDPSAYAPAARKEPFVLCAGRLWDEAKNLGALDAVAPRLAWPVYAAGDGESVARSAVTLGRLTESQLAAVMSRAAIYALPARYEPFGLSAVEAALSGCALALGDIPSLREVWGDAAAYVPPGDHGLLARTLGELIRNPRRRRRWRPGRSNGPAATRPTRWQRDTSTLTRHSQHATASPPTRPPPRNSQKPEPTCASSSSTTRSSPTGNHGTRTSSVASSRAARARADVRHLRAPTQERADTSARSTASSRPRLPSRLPRPVEHDVRPSRRSTSTKSSTAPTSLLVHE